MLRRQVTRATCALLLCALSALPGSFLLPAPKAHAAGAAGGNVYVPTNLRVKGIWLGGSQYDQTDILSWDKAPTAASYNVYQYDQQIASGLTATTYRVPPQLYLAKTYSVTAVNAAGLESIPSNLAGPIGASDPGNLPNWTTADPTAAPTAVSAKPDWNLGRPRITVGWQSDAAPSTYNVYRNGNLIATGMWVLYYVDTDVQPGQTYSYAITGVKDFWPTIPESARSGTVTAQAMSAQAPANSQRIQISGVQRNDDSVTVYFSPLAGAADYRIYKLSNPNLVKYAGVPNPNLTEPLSIEVNNVDIANGNDVVLVAVDKTGPFQTMDGTESPGMMWADGDHISTNGQGDPSNVPNVIGQSAAVHLSVNPRNLTGQQAFFDTFQNSQPLTEIPFDQIDPAIAAYQGNSDGFRGVSQYQNNKWKITDYEGDDPDSKLFFTNNHFMDTTYDGPSPSHGYSHNNNASVVLSPKATADISGGKVLHVTEEIDAHLNSRRFADVILSQAGQSLLRADPTKLILNPGSSLTPAANEIAWTFNSTDFDITQYEGKDANGNLIVKQLLDTQNGVGADSRTRAPYYASGPALSNGSMQDIDKRHIFDLFVSQTRIQIYEAGRLYKDVALDQPLPYSTIQANLTHEVYHTTNDRAEMIQYSAGTESYYYNFRPFSDERHWDNIGFEVLDSFSLAVPTVLPMEAPIAVTPAGNLSACLALSLATHSSGQQANPAVSLDFRDSNGSSIGSAVAAAATDGSVSVSNAPALELISSGQPYDVWVKPNGFLAQRLTGTRNLLSACHSIPQAFVGGDFNGDNRIDIGDIVTLIRAFNGSPSPVTQIVYTPAPQLEDIVTLIHAFNESPAGSL